MDSQCKKKNKWIGRLFLVMLLVVATATGVGIYINRIVGQIPPEIYVLRDNETTVNFNLPVTGERILQQEVSAASGHNMRSIQQVDFNQPVTFVGSSLGEYKLRIKLFGLFDVRTVSVNVVDEKYVYPCGFQIGMYLKTDGILAVNIGEFADYEGNVVRPCENIIQQGDYIVALNGEAISSKTEMIKKIEQSGGEKLTLTVRRNGQETDISVQPAADSEGKYKIGLWVKDDAQGIGTLTFIDDQNHFGALGHGISDSETSSLLQVSSGALYNTKIVSIVKGSNGQPGEFIGTIDYRPVNRLGEIAENTNCGIFGTLNTNLVERYHLSQMPIGYSYDVHNGEAFIRMYNEDENNFKDYAIDITETSTNESKNITFKVTSQELLDKTNGIVQGMSGCPIVQDGKVIGAVTHVFVDDSHRGYGVFIEKMLNKLPH